MFFPTFDLVLDVLSFFCYSFLHLKILWRIFELTFNFLNVLVGESRKVISKIISKACLSWFIFYITEPTKLYIEFWTACKKLFMHLFIILLQSFAVQKYLQDIWNAIFPLTYTGWWKLTIKFVFYIVR